ncbi:Serine/threonine-protein kinase STK11 [Hypsibius exemplaris]|uniref:non-specific serine/threonine protein kinase n=1 Tax=Hypsibius exemplaris TaxID=2072580 RepID=A0A1W0WC73_HYPEX|nr:Serine/threonine-protein kinase STK11 [Hypsibius exemplaris]
MPATSSPDCMAVCIPADQNETFTVTEDLLEGEDEEKGVSETDSLIPSSSGKINKNDFHGDGGDSHHGKLSLTNGVGVGGALLPPIPEADDGSLEFFDEETGGYELHHERSPSEEEPRNYLPPRRYLPEEEDFVLPAYARSVDENYGSHTDTAQLFRELLQISPTEHVAFSNGTDSHQYLFQHFDALEYEEAASVRPKFIGHYLLGDCLGEGSYAKVKEALDTDTLERAAVKIFSPVKLKRIPNGMQNVIKEVNILRKLDHPNVCRMKELLKKELKKKLYLIMDFAVCAISDLTKTLPQERLPAWKAHYYFLQLLDGLQYCHSRGVVHKDLKPSNLVITTQDTLKIIDFGVAEQLSPYAADDLITSSQGCPAVQSPEVADGEEYFSGFKLDVWSCGVTFFSLCAGHSKFPFVGDTVYELFANISERAHEMPASIKNSEPEFCSLIDALLEKKEANRPSLDELRHHHWVRRHWPMPPAGIPIQEVILSAETRSVDSFLPYIEAHYQNILSSHPSRAASICCANGDQMPHHHHHYPRCHSHHLTPQSSTRRSCHPGKGSGGIHDRRRTSVDSRTHLTHTSIVSRDADSFGSQHAAREKAQAAAASHAQESQHHNNQTDQTAANNAAAATEEGCFSSFKKWKICRLT